MTDSPHSEIFLARQGQEFGPFSRQQLVDGLQRGDFFNEDWVWWEGLEAWVPLSSLFPKVPPQLPKLPPKLPEQKQLPTNQTSTASADKFVRTERKAVSADDVVDAIGGGVEVTKGCFGCLGCLFRFFCVFTVFAGATTSIAIWLMC